MKISNIEQRLIETIVKYKAGLFFVIISVLGFFVRLPGRAFVSGDAASFLLPWFDIIEGNGIQSIGIQVGDYNMAYQLLIALLTYIPFNALYLYKGVSSVFDFLLAGVTALFVCQIKGKRSSNLFVGVYTAVLFVPTVILNSSVWAQCDSIFTTFIIAALYFLLKKQYKCAFAFLGVAFTFKLQTVFVLPFFLYYYFSEKEFSLSNFFDAIVFLYPVYSWNFVWKRDS